MLKQRLKELIESSEIPDGRLKSITIELENLGEKIYNKNRLLTALGVANISPNRLTCFISELENRKKQFEKVEEESKFLDFINRTITIEVSPEWSRKDLERLKPSTVSQIVEYSGAKINAQRAGVLLSGGGFVGGLNTKNKKVYLCRPEQ